MFDFHNHCLPALDDGAGNWEEALAMARMAVEDGVEGVVCTPHWARGSFENNRDGTLAAVAAYKEKLGEHNIPLEGLPRRGNPAGLRPALDDQVGRSPHRQRYGALCADRTIFGYAAAKPREHLLGFAGAKGQTDHQPSRTKPCPGERPDAALRVDGNGNPHADNGGKPYGKLWNGGPEIHCFTPRTPHDPYHRHGRSRTGRALTPAQQRLRGSFQDRGPGDGISDGPRNALADHSGGGGDGA